MREIKFRGKATLSIEQLDELGIEHENGWVYGSLISNGNMPYIAGNIVEATDEYVAHEFWAKVIPETVGQYTGLKDKNGKGIYEGDIYQYIIQGHFGGFYQEFERNDVVRYENGAFWVGEYLLVDALENDDEEKIIGNIYEHPQLLGGQQ